MNVCFDFCACIRVCVESRRTSQYGDMDVCRTAVQKATRTSSKTGFNRLLLYITNSPVSDTDAPLLLFSVN